MKKYLLFFFILNFHIFKCKISDNWITIFIHGSIGLRANFNLCTFRRLIRDKIKGTDYERNVLAIRENPYLFTMQPIQKLGLRPIENNCSSPCGPYAFSQLFDKMIRKYNFNQKNKYYTFGWSGLVSFSRRFEEARILYKELRNILSKLKKRGIEPKLRIVGYSHGATLAFNLAAIREQEFPQDCWQINEIISIGMPIINTTEKFINHPIFEKIYHIYSRADTIQRLDIFSPCNLFSRRRFHKCTARKLVQIELKITGKLLLSPNCKISRKMLYSTDQSPEHIELWFFGWTDSGYRQNWIMYPLPAAILTPYLIDSTNKFLGYSNHFIINVKPELECSIIQPFACKSKFCIPFMNLKEFNEFKWEACKFHPSQLKYKEKNIELQRNIDPKVYI